MKVFFKYFEDEQEKTVIVLSTSYMSRKLKSVHDYIIKKKFKVSYLDCNQGFSITSKENDTKIMKSIAFFAQVFHISEIR